MKDLFYRYRAIHDPINYATKENDKQEMKTIRKKLDSIGLILTMNVHLMQILRNFL